MRELTCVVQVCMCEEHAKTVLDTAVYFLPVILLTFEYFYLYLPEKHLLIFFITALKLTLLLLVRNIVHVCAVFSKSKFFFLGGGVKHV